MTVSLERLLNIIRAVGSEFTFEDMVKKSGLAHNTARKYLYEMVRQGLVVDLGGRYALSEKGLLLLEGEIIKRKTVSEKEAYVFTDRNSNPVVIKIDSIEKLYLAIKHGFIPEDVVVYHIEKGYIAYWLSESIGAKALAQKIKNIKTVPELIEVLELYLNVDHRR